MVTGEEDPGRNSIPRVSGLILKPFLKMNPSSIEKRVILIGASNVTRGLGLLIQECIARLGPPIEFMVAAGHGRSLGLSTQVIVRRLPSILDCGIWDALSQRKELPTYALVTDMGNDLPYEIKVNQLLSWYEELLSRLSELNANIVFAAPPIDSISLLEPWKFRLLLRILFPQSKLKFNDAIQNARDFAFESKKISNFFSAQIFEPALHWYGFDPIHIRRSCLAKAWKNYTQFWQNPGVEHAAHRRKNRTIPAWRFRPETMKFFGAIQQIRQPCWESKRVGTISLF